MECPDQPVAEDVLSELRPDPKLPGRGLRVVFERCTSSRCGGSSVYYRKSTTGGKTWGIASKVSSSSRKYHYPVDIEFATKTIVMFGDITTNPGDVFIRRGS